MGNLRFRFFQLGENDATSNDTDPVEDLAIQGVVLSTSGGNGFWGTSSIHWPIKLQQSHKLAIIFVYFI